jgi:phosphomannomutase
MSEKMEKTNLLFTPSGIRGKIGKDLNPKIVKKIVLAFGLWYEGNDKRVIIGRDTRPSGKEFEKAVIDGLIASGFKIINTGVCPTPVIIHAKNSLNIPAGIIITGSHNSQEWNGLKLLSNRNFLNAVEVEVIKDNLNTIKLKSWSFKSKKNHVHVENLNPYKNYSLDLFKHIDLKGITRKNNLRVVIDTGAGAGKFATPQILKKMGCNVRLINDELLVKNTFPRGIEPIETNLRDLIVEVWQGKFDLGFAHDSDADRLAIIGDDGAYYPGDIGLSLILEDYLKKYSNSRKEIIFITNLASSLRFEVLAEKYNATVIRTPIGERYLTAKMNSLIKKNGITSKNLMVFGGEGSGGGFMFPYFNKTRDGIFAAVKITEILIKSGKKISNLVAKLPRYYSHREHVKIKEKDIPLIIELVKKELIEEGENVEQINLDLRFGKEKEWFVLIHPSNTEPLIRVISEAKRESLARVYCEVTSELIKLIIKRM